MRSAGRPREFRRRRQRSAMVNFPGGGAARIENADVRGARPAPGCASPAATASLITGPRPRPPDRRRYRNGRRRLPHGQVLLRQPRSGAPMSGVARFAPYQAGASRLALDPIRFQAGRRRIDQLQHRRAARRAASRTAGSRRCGCRSTAASARAAASPSARGCVVVELALFPDARVAVRADAAAGLPDRPGDRLASRPAETCASRLA